MRQTSSPEELVTNHKIMMLNKSPKASRPYIHGGSLKSHITALNFTL
jgi:hypothetical protein